MQHRGSFAKAILLRTARTRNPKALLDSSVVAFEHDHRLRCLAREYTKQMDYEQTRRQCRSACEYRADPCRNESTPRLLGRQLFRAARRVGQWPDRQPLAPERHRRLSATFRAARGRYSG